VNTVEKELTGTSLNKTSAKRSFGNELVDGGHAHHPIPSQHRVTIQILDHWNPFPDLKLVFVGSSRAEQLGL
jgi:hypothetical protein